MARLLLVIGTRPEAIKMAGLVYELRKRHDVEWQLCSTGQHGSMLDETLRDLGIEADLDLGIMGRANGLPEVTSAALLSMTPIIERAQPDWILVQGDTTTAMAVSLAAFHQKVAVGHVEAGLRTWDRYSPWPEEVNRKVISAIATKHFAPTRSARANLLKEGIPARDILVTGNTVIDALFATRDRALNDPGLAAALEVRFAPLNTGRPMVLVTGHRRESFGDGFRRICEALRRIACSGHAEVVFPVHLNPNVRQPVMGLLGSVPRIHLLEPQGYVRFVSLMNRAHILLTDSGGIQEEGPSIGKPVLVMRDKSERPEAIAAGCAQLIGTDVESIVGAVNTLLHDPVAYARMSNATNVYGDGLASRRILESLVGSAHSPTCLGEFMVDAPAPPPVSCNPDPAAK
jgi:UDP-N-acetylglucosamine 2-epimerase (non-hydrolysing)